MQNQHAMRNSPQHLKRKGTEATAKLWELASARQVWAPNHDAHSLIFEARCRTRRDRLRNARRLKWDPARSRFVIYRECRMKLNPLNMALREARACLRSRTGPQTRRPPM